MGVTTLDSYDFLGTGDGIELRSAELEWMCGARVIEWSIRCSSDFGVMFKWCRWKASSHECGNV